MPLFMLLFFLGSQPGWSDGDLTDALERARSRDQAVLMVVHAHWCGPCHQLAKDVLNAESGSELLKDHVGVRIDFDSTEGQRITAQYAVLNLPSVLVLSADGTELGRVEGYMPGPEFTRAVAKAEAGGQDPKVLASLAAQSPDDPKINLEYAQLLLVKKREKEAYAILKRFMDTGGSHGAAAYRIWGRWLVRIQRKGLEGAEHFLKAYDQYKNQNYAPGFLYWAAKGYHVAGRDDKAIALFDDWLKRQPAHRMAMLLKIDFLVHYGIKTKLAERLLRKVLKKEPRNASYHYMLAQLMRKTGRLDEAEKEIRLALRSQPHRAMYQSFLKSLQAAKK